MAPRVQPWDDNVWWAWTSCQEIFSDHKGGLPTECALLTSTCSVSTLYHWLLIIDKSSSIATSYPVSRDIDPKALANINKKPLPCFLPMCRSCWGVWIMEEGSPSTRELSVWLRGGETAGGGHDWPWLTHHHRGNQWRKLNKDRLLPSRWGLLNTSFIIRPLYLSIA